MVHVFNPTIEEAEAGELGIWSQPGFHAEKPSQQKQNKDTSCENKLILLKKKKSSFLFSYYFSALHHYYNWLLKKKSLWFVFMTKAHRVIDALPL